MSDAVINDNESVIDIARQLVDELECGNDASASLLLDELTSKREQGLFRKIGEITRKLHNSLRELQVDSRLADQAEVSIPDCRERLNYVVSLTEKAAGKTLTAVESSLPLVNDLKSQAESLSINAQQFNKSENTSSINELVSEATLFSRNTIDHSANLRDHLSTIIMAQDFQDLTGQIISQVIGITQEIETSLVNLVRTTGQQMKLKAEDVSVWKNPDNEVQAFGPHVPGLENGDVAQNQDDVDDLLSSLGF